MFLSLLEGENGSGGKRENVLLKWNEKMGKLLCWIKEITYIFALSYSVEQNLYKSFYQEKSSALHHEFPWIQHQLTP